MLSVFWDVWFFVFVFVFFVCDGQRRDKFPVLQFLIVVFTTLENDDFTLAHVLTGLA